MYLLIDGNSDEKAWKVEEEASPGCTTITDEDLLTLNHITDAVRLSALIVDTPTNEMNVDHFLEVNIIIYR